MEQKHNCYNVNLNQGNYSCTCAAMDQPVICADVTPVFKGPWTRELDRLSIQISDSIEAAPIELLIGADIAGKLYRGKRHVLECGSVAVETLLGWSLMGKIPLETLRSPTMTAISLFVRNASIADLWELDALEITEPSEKKTCDEMAQAAKDLFLQTITVNSEGRYQVRLPWLEGHRALPSNYSMAKKRLDNTVKKLKGDGFFESYDQVFDEWLTEEIIEEVHEGQPSLIAIYLTGL